MMCQPQRLLASIFARAVPDGAISPVSIMLLLTGRLPVVRVYCALLPTCILPVLLAVCTTAVLRCNAATAAAAQQRPAKAAL
jgi:hypothetical protein